MGKKKPSSLRVPADESIRLNRALAQAGIGSRRECETLILEGRVQIDGKVVDELGVRVNIAKQKIQVDGTRLRPTRYQYFAVNKPPGVLSTCADPSGRTRVIDLIDTTERVYNVGRLDKSSEGLILVTNDGELANRLTHPRYGVEKTYLVTVVGRPTADELRKLRTGVYLAEGRARVSRVEIKKRRKLQSDLIIVLDEGRNREIRRLLAQVGHKVVRLKRIAIGPLRLGDLPLGAHRKLERREIDALKRLRTTSSRNIAGNSPHGSSKNSGRSKKKTARVSARRLGTKASKKISGGKRKRSTRPSDGGRAIKRTGSVNKKSRRSG